MDASLTCPICIELLLEAEELGLLNSCAHVFCYDCITTWSKYSNCCPVDRLNFNTITIREYLDGPNLNVVPVKPPHETTGDEDDFVEHIACEVCDQTNDEHNLLLCDGCDKAYHMNCLNPPLDEIPVDEWFCDNCNQNERSDNYVAVIDAVCDAISQRWGESTRCRRTRNVARTRFTERIRTFVQIGRELSSDFDEDTTPSSSKTKTSKKKRRKRVKNELTDGKSNEHMQDAGVVAVRRRLVNRLGLIRTRDCPGLSQYGVSNQSSSSSGSGKTIMNPLSLTGNKFECEPEADENFSGTPLDKSPIVSSYSSPDVLGSILSSQSLLKQPDHRLLVTTDGLIRSNDKPGPSVFVDLTLQSRSVTKAPKVNLCKELGGENVDFLEKFMTESTNEHHESLPHGAELNEGSNSNIEDDASKVEDSTDDGKNTNQILENNSQNTDQSIENDVDCHDNSSISNDATLDSSVNQTISSLSTQNAKAADDATPIISEASVAQNEMTVATNSNNLVKNNDEDSDKVSVECRDESMSLHDSSVHNKSALGVELSQTLTPCSNIHSNAVEPLEKPERKLPRDKVENLSCEICECNHDEATMLLCDECDRGYHCACLEPPLDDVPEGDWICHKCKPTPEPTSNSLTLHSKCNESETSPESVLESAIASYQLKKGYEIPKKSQTKSSDIASESVASTDSSSDLFENPSEEEMKRLGLPTQFNLSKEEQNARQGDYNELNRDQFQHSSSYGRMRYDETPGWRNERGLFTSPRGRWGQMVDEDRGRVNRNFFDRNRNNPRGPPLDFRRGGVPESYRGIPGDSRRGHMGDGRFGHGIDNRFGYHVERYRGPVLHDPFRNQHMDPSRAPPNDWYRAPVDTYRRPPLENYNGQSHDAAVPGTRWSEHSTQQCEPNSSELPIEDQQQKDPLPRRNSSSGRVSRWGDMSSNNPVNETEFSILGETHKDGHNSQEQLVNTSESKKVLSDVPDQKEFNDLTAKEEMNNSTTVVGEKLEAENLQSSNKPANEINTMPNSSILPESISKNDDPCSDSSAALNSNSEVSRKRDHSVGKTQEDAEDIKSKNGKESKRRSRSSSSDSRKRKRDRSSSRKRQNDDDYRGREKRNSSRSRDFDSGHRHNNKSRRSRSRSRKRYDNDRYDRHSRRNDRGHRSRDSRYNRDRDDDYHSRRSTRRDYEEDRRSRDFHQHSEPREERQENLDASLKCSIEDKSNELSGANSEKAVPDPVTPTKDECTSNFYPVIENPQRNAEVQPPPRFSNPFSEMSPQSAPLMRFPPPQLGERPRFLNSFSPAPPRFAPNMFPPRFPPNQPQMNLMGNPPGLHDQHFNALLNRYPQSNINRAPVPVPTSLAPPPCGFPSNSTSGPHNFFGQRFSFPFNNSNMNPPSMNTHPRNPAINPNMFSQFAAAGLNTVTSSNILSAGDVQNILNNHQQGNSQTSMSAEHPNSATSPNVAALLQQIESNNTLQPTADSKDLLINTSSLFSATPNRMLEVPSSTTPDSKTQPTNATNVSPISLATIQSSLPMINNILESHFQNQNQNFTAANNPLQQLAAYGNTSASFPSQNSSPELVEMEDSMPMFNSPVREANKEPSLKALSSSANDQTLIPFIEAKDETAVKEVKRENKKNNKKDRNTRADNSDDEERPSDIESSANEMQLKKKLVDRSQMQTKVAELVKQLLMPHFKKKTVTKDEYKDIMRKTVNKVVKRGSNEIKEDKITKLVNAYVDHYKAKRTKSSAKSGEFDDDDF